MQIAILGYRRGQREDVEKHIRVCLGRGSPYTLRQYSLDEPRYNPAPLGLVAAFAIVDGVRTLDAVKKLANWGEDLPLVIVMAKPAYTLDGKLTVKSCLTFPLAERDMWEAIRRVGLEAMSSDANAGPCALPETQSAKERQIAIFGARLSRRDELEAHIRSCLGGSGEIDVWQYGMSEPSYNPAPLGLAAAFIVVEDALAIDTLHKVTNWRKELPELPVVIVGGDPGYALEGIRRQVTYYILFPPAEEDMREALRRCGIGGDTW